MRAATSAEAVAEPEAEAEAAARAFVAATNMEYDKLARSRLSRGAGEASAGGGAGRDEWCGMQSIVKWGAGQVLHKIQATKKRRRTLPTHVRCGCS